MIPLVWEVQGDPSGCSLILLTSNKGRVIVYDPNTKTQHLFGCQQHLGNKVMGHPVILYDVLWYTFRVYVSASEYCEKVVPRQRLHLALDEVDSLVLERRRPVRVRHKVAGKVLADHQFLKRVDNFQTLETNTG